MDVRPCCPRELQRKLLCCLLHANELTLRHHFDACDGYCGTTGPSSFGGPMGKEMKRELHLVSFKSIPDNLEEISKEILDDLSRDQKLLYRYIKAVSSGEVLESLASQRVGPVNLRRWLTLAVRLLHI